MGSRTFHVLGVTFSTEVHDLWGLNGPQKLSEIKQLLAQWTKRKLTIYGKICVAKSLAISKLVYLLIALHDPPKHFIKLLQSIFFKFIWKGPDKIKRELAYQKYDNGGLKMVNLEKFATALKITWFRRIISGPKKWQTSFDKIVTEYPYFWKTGPVYIAKKLITISNPFWRDVLKSWTEFYGMRTNLTLDNIRQEPLWFNDKHRNTSLFYEAWAKKNICTLNDIISENGMVMTFDEFKANYSIHGTVLDYNRLIHNIPNDWLKALQSESKSMNMSLNRVLSDIVKDKKGCNTLYWSLLQPVTNTQYISRWELELNNEQTRWKMISLIPFKCTKDTKLHDFQYRILHRILTTNILLKKLNIQEDDLCSYCQECRETITHLFYGCNKVKQFWESIETWLSENCNEPVKFSKEDILLGVVKGNYDLYNHIILMVKYYIYCTKFKKEHLNKQHIINCMRRQCLIEKKTAFAERKMTVYFQKWSTLYNVLLDNSQQCI